MSKKKREENLANGGLSPIKKKLLSAQHKANKVLANHFPKLAFTVDGNTERMMDALRERTHISRGAIARTIISEVIDSPELFPIKEFYEEVWLNTYFRPEGMRKVMELLLPGEFNGYLRKTSEEILGTENRSEMFRLLVALYATKKGRVNRKRSEVFEFDVPAAGSSKPHD